MIKKIYLDDIDLAKMFAEEWRNGLDYIEKEILKLEVQPDDNATISSIAEKIHTIKRGLSYVGLAPMIAVSFEIEQCILLVSDGLLPITTEAIDDLLLCVDCLKQCVARILDAINHPNPSVDITEQFVEIPFDGLGSNIVAKLQQQREKRIPENSEESQSSIDLESGQNCDRLNETAMNVGEEIIAEVPDHLAQLATESEEVAKRQSSNKGTPLPEKSALRENKLENGVHQSIRVSQEKIDKMMNMISELLIAKNSFLHISSKLDTEYDMPQLSKEVKQVGAYVNRISDELQNTVMSIRMVEVKTVFQKMPRVIRDIAQSTGKKMRLEMEGENTEIDKTIIEKISDPLIHLIRNAADHGVEDAQVRLSKGKPEEGRILLRAYNRDKYVYIEIEDDGKGIDSDTIKKKAIEKGFITEADAEKMSQKQLVNLIFIPGFSTAKKVTEISGRGVGMDIVKSNIVKVNGKVTVESEVDKGTKMIIQLPLTLAVSRGLIVEAANNSFIIPLDYISETVKIAQKSIHQYHDKYFTSLRGDVIGLDWLSRIFLLEEAEANDEDLNAVILSDGGEKFAVVVGKLKNEQEFVVKAMEGQLASIPGISGSTLLGDGKVILIINPTDILKMV